MRVSDQQEGGSDLPVQDPEKGNRAEIPVHHEDPAEGAGRVYIDGWNIRVFGHANDDPVLCVACGNNKTCDHDPIGKPCYVPCG